MSYSIKSDSSMSSRTGPSVSMMTGVSDNSIPLSDRTLCATSILFLVNSIVVTSLLM